MHCRADKLHFAGEPPRLDRIKGLAETGRRMRVQFSHTGTTSSAPGYCSSHNSHTMWAESSLVRLGRTQPRRHERSGSKATVAQQLPQRS